MSAIYTANKTAHYPLTLNATYTCATGKKHSFWHADAMAEQRIDYSPLLTIEEALREFCSEKMAAGGKLVLATDPVTSRKITEFFGKRLGKERKIALEQRVIQFEPDVPVLGDEAPLRAA